MPSETSRAQAKGGKSAVPTLLAPIVVNIALFHVLLAPGLPMVVLLLGLELYLAWSYRAAFAPRRHAVGSRPKRGGSGCEVERDPCDDR